MTSRDFCYWLQGVFEVGGVTSLNKAQTDLIKKHLHMVFEHEIDPSFPDREKLEQIHTPPEELVTQEAVNKVLEELPSIDIPRPQVPMPKYGMSDCNCPRHRRIMC